MKTITKKEFIETLATKKNILLGSFLNLGEVRRDKIMKTALSYSRKLEESDKNYVRTCVRKQSNALQFSNGSWFYFNDIKGATCMMHNDIILSYVERYDDFDEKNVYDIMVYLVG